MDQSAVARRTEQTIIRLCQAGLDSQTLQVEVLRRLRRIIPVDAAFCATVDPATLLFTGSITEEIPASVTPAFLSNEFLQDDVTKFVHLARSARPVQSLYQATHDEPDRSPRYRDILAPIGFGDELRAALRVGSVTWGVMCLHRDLTGSGFTPAELTMLERIVPHLAVGLRTALLIEQSRADPGPDGPGLVVLAEDLSIAAVTAPAAQWLTEVSDWPQRSEPPQTVLAVATRLLALEQATERAAELMPRVRVQTRSGRWLVLHASRLTGPAGSGQIAVIVEPAAPADVAPLLLQAYGLTDREAQVAQHVLQGLATSEIAASLVDCGTDRATASQGHLRQDRSAQPARARRPDLCRAVSAAYQRTFGLWQRSENNGSPDGS